MVLQSPFGQAERKALFIGLAVPIRTVSQASGEAVCTTSSGLYPYLYKTEIKRGLYGLSEAVNHVGSRRSTCGRLSMVHFVSQVSVETLCHGLWSVITFYSHYMCACCRKRAVYQQPGYVDQTVFSSTELPAEGDCHVAGER